MSALPQARPRRRWLLVLKVSLIVVIVLVTLFADAAGERLVDFWEAIFPPPPAEPDPDCTLGQALCQAFANSRPPGPMEQVVRFALGLAATLGVAGVLRDKVLDRVFPEKEDAAPVVEVVAVPVAAGPVATAEEPEAVMPSETAVEAPAESISVEELVDEPVEEPAQEPAEEPEQVAPPPPVADSDVWVVNAIGYVWLVRAGESFDADPAPA